MCRSCADRHIIIICAKLDNRDACSNAVRSAVFSRLDYLNVFLGGLRKIYSIRLRRVQNRAAHLVTRTKIHDQIRPVLRDLHWLTISSWIDFKL